MSSDLAVAVFPNNNDDNADRDGHFPGLVDDRVKETIAALNHVPSRRWTYLRVARRARLMKAPTKGKARRAPHPAATSLLTDTEYRALDALVMAANKDLSNSYPGLPKLAKHDNWSLRVLHDVVRSLVAKGWITRENCSHLGTAVNQFFIPAGILAPWADEWMCPARVKLEK